MESAARLSPTGGTRWTVILFWSAAALSCLAGLLYFGLDLKRQTAVDLGGALGAIVSTIPSLALSLAFLFGIRGVRKGRLIFASAVAIVALIVDIVLAVNYIATLATFCSALPGCKHRAASLYVLAADQLLYGLGIFSAALALITCGATTLRRNLFPA